MFKYICFEQAVTSSEVEAGSIDGGKEPTAMQGKQDAVNGNYLPFVAVAGAVMMVVLVGVFLYRKKKQTTGTVREIVPSRQNLVESML